MYIYKSYLKAVIIPTLRLAANDVLQASTQKNVDKQTTKLCDKLMAAGPYTRIPQ